MKIVKPTHCLYAMALLGAFSISNLANAVDENINRSVTEIPSGTSLRFTGGATFRPSVGLRAYQAFDGNDSAEKRGVPLEGGDASLQCHLIMKSGIQNPDVYDSSVQVPNGRIMTLERGEGSGYYGTSMGSQYMTNFAIRGDRTFSHLRCSSTNTNLGPGYLRELQAHLEKNNIRLSFPAPTPVRFDAREGVRSTPAVIENNLNRADPANEAPAQENREVSVEI